jgi:hypothetical protein
MEMEVGGHFGTDTHTVRFNEIIELHRWVVQEKRVNLGLGSHSNAFLATILELDGGNVLENLLHFLVLYCP